MQSNAHTLTVAAGDRLIRRAEVERITALSRSNIYHRIQHDPDWPKPIHIGPNSVAWLESEVFAWVERRIAAARAKAA